MPETLFSVQLPDGVVHECYSPSTVVRDYFKAGEELPMAEFVRRSREALTIASERVRAKYGMGCSGAASQLAAIVSFSRRHADDGVVRIVSIR